MQINKRIKISIGILGTVTLLLYGAVVIPSAYAITETKAKVAEEHAKIERRYLLRSVMRNSQASLDQTKTQLRQLSSIAIREGEELAFINALETAATDAGLGLDIVLETVNQKDLTAWEKEIPLRLVIVGDFVSTLEFIDAVERLPYYVIINNVSARSTAGTVGPESAGSADARTELSGTVYMLSNDAPDFVVEKTEGPAE